MSFSRADVPRRCRFYGGEGLLRNRFYGCRSSNLPLLAPLPTFKPQEILSDDTKHCLVGLNRLQVVLACLAGKLLGALVSGGIGSLDGGEAPNDLRAAVEEEVRRRSASSTLPEGAASAAAATGTQGGSRGEGRVGPAAATTERDWLQSPLLANGLVKPPENSTVGGDFDSDSFGAGMAEDGVGGIGPVGVGATAVFLRELVEGASDSPALALSQWVSKHVGENPVLARTGGPLVARGVRGAAAAMLWHSGCAAAAQRMAAVLAGAPSASRTRVESQVPPFFLLETWRKAVGLKSWAKSRRDRGTPYEATAARLNRLCRFLLSLHPATSDRPVGWLVQEFKTLAAAAAASRAATPATPEAAELSPTFLSAPPIPRRRSPSPTSRGLAGARSLSAGSSGGGVGSSGRSRWAGFPSSSEAGSGSLLRALETRHAEGLSLIMGFLKSSVDLCRLRAGQLAVDSRAKRRAAGLTALRSLLAATGREGSSGVKAALLLYVPPALRGVLHGLAALGPDPIALQVRMGRPRLASFPPLMAPVTGFRSVVRRHQKLTGHFNDFSPFTFPDIHHMLFNYCRWLVRLLPVLPVPEAQQVWDY